MTAIIFILVLSVLVIIHELGHFLAARKHSITVKEFGLGYPPRLLKLFTWRGTDFSLNSIPFGGFVQMEGEDAVGDHSQGAFYSKSIRARLEVLLAGVFFNFIFGILAFALVFYQLGIPVPLIDQVRIHSVVPGSPAQQAGLQENTNLVAVRVQEEWVEVGSIATVQQLVTSHPGETIGVRTSVACEYESCPAEYQERDIYVRAPEEIPEGEGSMGVIFTETVLKKYPWYLMPFMTIFHAFEQSIALAGLILQALWQLLVDLFQGRGLQQEIAGPIGIVDQAQTYGFFDGGWLSVVNFAALLSINLGIMNLLPIPALDGGRAILVFLENFIRRSRIEKVANYLNYAGYLLLLSLMILVSFNDIKNLMH